MSAGPSGAERPRPLPLLRDLSVWAALMGLLALSCWAAYWPLGPITTAIGLGIAAIKAGFVAAFFMNLKRGTPLLRLTGLAGFFWIAILFALTLSDVLTRL
ncbi:oxidase [Alsobacter soli]|uniref:Oxidase n=1 Tax=Alsobacter soli TaxID=2109933 RepID=A0A2T1HXQ7_9HYPH|nr:cytochrome C oxidase subunit IV family protein [Alsobacter soli]PSC06483.1 oxidase [Alsobacter soli]